MTVADLIRYRMQHERYVRRIAESVLPTKYGDFRMIAYSSDVDHEMHVALVRGDVAERCATDTAPQARRAAAGARPFALPHGRCSRLNRLRLPRDHRSSLAAIAKRGRGVFVYLHHTGRGFQIDTRAQEDGALPRILYHAREPTRPRIWAASG